MNSNPTPPSGTFRALPKGPVLGWSSFQREHSTGIASVEDLPHVAFTTSGRAAIYQALLQLELPPDSTVLVPTYHCPTMVAPVLLNGLRPTYFGIRNDGLPDLDSIAPSAGQHARAMIVSHYFGLGQSLHEVRQWCDARQIALIEDCAHCYFGQAGERPIGAWGDYCTASLSKFFPVPECGLLGSAFHPIRPLQLTRQSLKAQAKGWVDVIETAAKYHRLAGMNHVLGDVFKLKRGAPPTDNLKESTGPISTIAMMEACDMARIGRRPLAASNLLRKLLPRGQIIGQRKRNFSVYSEMLSQADGVTALTSMPTSPDAPYVFPLWVDDADRIYHALRLEGIPVFRWDRIWSGTPHLERDVGLDWSQHVIQFLCHQDLSEDDIRHSARRMLSVLESSPGITGNNMAMQSTKLCSL